MYIIKAFNGLMEVHKRLLFPNISNMKVNLFNLSLTASFLPDNGLSLTLASGGGDATGVEGLDEYDPPLSVG